MHKPHGGRLINRFLDSKSADEIRKVKDKFSVIRLSHERLQDIFNIAYGVFSPLEGFMNEEDFKSVLIRSRLANDIPWTIPIVLDVDDEFIARCTPGDIVLLKETDNKITAILTVEEVFKYDKTEYVRSVFGTEDLAHPGVKKVCGMKNNLVAGTVDLVEDPENPFVKYTLHPKETRILFREKGWVDIAGFQTRNIPHVGHEYVQKTALSFVDGLFINPVIGQKKAGDFKDKVILESYNALLEHYFLKERAVMSILLTEMRYAGPKEAIFHAIVRKNFGCTHFIIGRDHAGVGNFYDPFAAHKIFDQFPDLEIIPIFFKSFFYCRKCASIANDKTCPHGEDEKINFKGTEIRQMLQAGEVPPESMMRPEVAKVILSHKNPFV